VTLAIVLIVVGGIIVLVGEILGVRSKESGDTITDWFRWANKKTNGLLAVPLLAGLVLLFTHLVFDWP
jgi:hypothetical protein